MSVKCDCGVTVPEKDLFEHIKTPECKEIRSKLPKKKVITPADEAQMRLKHDLELLQQAKVQKSMPHNKEYYAMQKQWGMKAAQCARQIDDEENKLRVKKNLRPIEYSYLDSKGKPMDRQTIDPVIKASTEGVVEALAIANRLA